MDLYIRVAYLIDWIHNKFGGNSEKECIIIFVMESCDKMDCRNQDEYLYLCIPCYNRNTFSVNLT